MGSETPVSTRFRWKDILNIRYLGHRGVKDIYWPLHKNSEVTHPRNIFVGINSNPGTRPGCYIQGNGGVYIGNFCEFASNIGVISANHNIYNQKEHDCKPEV